jgi:biotin-(acetyl-CoA carboxylase) ligase
MADRQRRKLLHHLFNRQSAIANQQSVMDLAEFVRKYTELSPGFGGAVHLSQFGLSKAETEKVISAFDDDYQISRYMVLSREPDEELHSYPSEARVYFINGFEVSHVSLGPGIGKVL